MEFNATITGAAFVILFGVLAAGTITSGMPTQITMMVLPGLLVFMLLTLYVGIKHGEYRAGSSR